MQHEHFPETTLVEAQAGAGCVLTRAQLRRKWVNGAYRCVSLLYAWASAAADAELEGTRRQLTAAEETVAELTGFNEAT